MRVYQIQYPFHGEYVGESGARDFGASGSMTWTKHADGSVTVIFNDR